MQTTISPGRPRARARVAGADHGYPPPVDRGRGTAGDDGHRPRRGDPIWARLMVVLGALLMMTSGGVIVGGKYLVGRYTGAIQQERLLGDAAATDGKGRASIAGPINLLLVGIDERDDDPANGARADSIMIMHIPASHDAAYIVSVPRDSYVQIPAFPKSGYRGGEDKINAAFALGAMNNGGRNGGFNLLALTLNKLTGLKFNGFAIVNFDGFRALVAAMGGVDMCVDEKVTSIHVGFDKGGKYAPPFRIGSDLSLTPVPGIHPQVYLPGCQHLTGWQALDYVRQRDLLANGDGDYGRQRHQQQFIKAVAKQAMTKDVITNPVKLDQVIRAAGKAFTFDSGGVAIEDWLFTLKSVDPGNLVMIKTNAGKYNPKIINGIYFESLGSESLQLFQAFREDKVDTFIVAHPDWVSADS